MKSVCAAIAVLFSLIAPSTSYGREKGGPGYTNPILWSDYSDPDVCAVDGEYWMTSSSFNCVPGLQILHSTDLVNWEIAGAALPRLGIFDGRTAPAHGEGVWAPSIRHHDGLFYICWGDPDRGIYEVHAPDPRGRWSSPRLVLEGIGIIDACPLWDDDGRVYVVHGWAGSRAGFNSILTVRELEPDLSGAKGPAVMVFDGISTGNRTVEGPKFYKRGGMYYIFAPAGGVPEGWQLVMRSRSVYGPYEHRVVLHKGGTSVNGPHQGGWVEDAAGDSWFMHFQDMGPWGRVVHLQPMEWTEDGWCRMGVDSDGDGIGEPVAAYRGPAGFKGQWGRKVGKPAGILSALETSAGFREACAAGLTPEIPLNWQWHAGPSANWGMLFPERGCLRLNCIRPAEGWRNLWDSPNLLLEKIAGPSMDLEVELSFTPSYPGERAGIVVMGLDYATLEMVWDGKEARLEQRVCRNASKGGEESVEASVPLAAVAGEAVAYPVHTDIPAVYRARVRVHVGDGAVCRFSYGTDGNSRYKTLGPSFQAREGRWIGAKAGFFAVSSVKKNRGGFAEFR